MKPMNAQIGGKGQGKGRRYRLVCTVRTAPSLWGWRRCRWTSRSWRIRSPFETPPEMLTSARAHMRLMHPESDDIFDAPRWRRCRRGLRWALLTVGVAAVLAAAVTLIALAGVAADTGGWWSR